jgi:heat-inducible transcriptional repressor
MIGVVALPKRNQIKLRQVEFLSLSSNRVLVILVLNDREVQNRIIYTDRPYSASELQQAANYLNSHFVGKELTAARQELLATIKADKEHMGSLLKAAIEVADNAGDDEQKDYVMAGQNDLLSGAKKGDLENLYNVFQAFTQKQEILNLLNHSMEAEGIQIFIGGESGYEAFDDCSIVTTSYAVDGQLIGSLGVIGPQRMPYERVISAVDVTSRLLSAALNQG